MSSAESNTEGLRKLNKDLLTRNAELVKKLNRMKIERDNFEQLFTDWKKINKDASEALHLLQKDKQKCQEENYSLHQQINEYKHLLLHNNNNNNNNNINTLKFNYQQKKNEIDQILYQIQKLFHFCQANYPQITSHEKQYKLLNDIKEEEDYQHNNEFDRKQIKKKKKTRDFRKKKHRSTRSLSDFDKEIFKKRRSLNYISNENEKEKKKKKEKQQRIVINVCNNNENENIDNKITPELLGPKTSYHQYGADRNDPFGRTQSSHSFFNQSTQQKQQKYRYNHVQLNMSANNKLWSKRDSLSRKKKKQPRINAIPSSAGSTPLTTPQHSVRGKLSSDPEHSDSDSDNIPFHDEDPHQKYLEMMQNNNSSHNREKLTDKKTIHDLFDMLQQQTLSPASPPPIEPEQEENNNNNAQLVPLPEPSDSSSDSSSD